MAIAVRIAGYTRVLVGPPGMDNVHDLYVRDAPQDGYNVILSAWELLPHEIEAVNRGEPIILAIVGNTMPPVAVDVRFGSKDTTGE